MKKYTPTNRLMIRRRHRPADHLK